LIATAALCLAITAICYANSLRNDFILDDKMIVASNPAIRTIQPLHYFSTPFWGKGSREGIYRPLVMFSFSLEYSIWQRWSPGFHLINILLHALNGFLVFLLARQILGSNLPAWGASVIYLAHPVHTEAVAGIAGRSELLSATFLLLAWLLFRRRHTGWCVVAFACSLLSKENAVAFLGVAVLDIWISGGSFSDVIQSWKRLAAIAGTTAAYFGVRAWVLGAAALTPPQYLNGAWTFVERELTSARAFLKYFQLVAAPLDVSGDYDFNSIPLANLRSLDAWLGVALIAATIVIAIALRKRMPAVSLGILFFYVTMFPMSNWLVPTNLIMAERYLYVPLVGVSLIAGLAWSRIVSRERRLWTALGVLVVSVLLCISHNLNWSDDYTFYKNMVRVVPNNIRARQGWGVALLESGRVEEAKEQFEAGLQIARNAGLLFGMAGTLAAIDRNCSRARPLLDEALQIEPGNTSAYWMLAECFEKEGNPASAAETYEKAVDATHFPDARLLYDWGLSLEKIGKNQEAVEVYRRAALIDPNDLIIKTKLKSLPAKMGS